MDTSKQKHPIASNVSYMVKLALKHAPSVLVFIAIEVLLILVISLLELYFTPTVLAQILAGVKAGTLLQTILIFALSIIMLKALSNYLKDIHLFGRIELRLLILNAIIMKNITTSNINTEKKAFRNQLDRSVGYTSNNQTATEAIWQTLQNLLQYLLGFGMYLFILRDVDYRIIILSLITTLITHFMMLRANAFAHANKDRINTFYSKINYIGRISRDRHIGKDIRLLKLQPWLISKYDETTKEQESIEVTIQKHYFIADISDVIMTLLRNGIAYYFLISMAINGQIDATQFILYFSTITIFTQWVTNILTEFSTLHKQALELQTIRDFISTHEPFDFKTDKVLPKANDYTIELVDVSFKYPDSDKAILEHLNLTINAGEKLAIVGLNGAGKTTLIKLIVGLYNPTSGKILVNGEDITALNRSDYYTYFSAVFQDHSILPVSIKDNIIGSLPYRERKFEQSIMQSGLAPTLNKLDKGFDTMLTKEVFEDAVNLSGGETQRLLLARALYKDAPILILDEPTAALDPIAEKEMYENYANFSKGKTSVFISHRLASTRFCDRIIYLENGNILEAGTHDSLIDEKGEYAKLFDVQSQYYKENPNE